MSTGQLVHCSLKEVLADAHMRRQNGWSSNSLGYIIEVNPLTGLKSRIPSEMPRLFHSIGSLVKVRDETLRDGNQGEVPRSAFDGLCHIFKAHPFVDLMTIGWPYSNPADQELADYLRKNLSTLQSKYPELHKNKFYLYSLMHLGSEASENGVSRNSPFGQMLEDMKNGTNPFGMVNVLSKARVGDLQDFGEGFTSEKCIESIANTMKLLRQADPTIKLELSLEHFFSAWTESKDNRPHIINAIVTALLSGADRILIPDTDGAMIPSEIKKIINDATKALQKDHRLVEANIKFHPFMFDAHMHNDKGLGAANTLAALEAGCGSFDSNFGRMGERLGNARIADVFALLKHPESASVLDYTQELEQTLGIRNGDKEPGCDGAYNAVGGMHGSRLWKSFYAGLDKQKISDSKYILNEYEKFMSEYRGSYATVSPADFNRKIHPSLSPVAGASNVQLTLASMGMIIDKSDPRIATVLTEIKNGEHFNGSNYRGFNNCNALLLVAKTFGLWKPLQENPIEFISNLIDSTNNTSNEIIDSNENSLSSFEYESFEKQDAELFYNSYDLFLQLQNKFSIELQDLNLIGARNTLVPCGKISFINTCLNPAPENLRNSVRLVFENHLGEQVNAHGVGDSLKEALLQAFNTIIESHSIRNIMGQPK